MASPSRPFQSQVMTHAVRFYHRLTATGTRWARYCQSTILLWTQIVLYPTYVAFQAMRVVRRQAQAVTTHWRDRLKLNSRRSRQLSSHLPLTADWGIQQVLSAVLPPTVELQTKADTHRAFWEVDDQTLPLQPLQLPTAIHIHGLASDLENRALVLVRTDNQVVDGLSAEQQAAIATVISQLMAAYCRWQRQQHQLRHLQAGPLPLPTVSARAWWPVRVIIWLMAWVQTGTVAATANLFKEAETRYRLPIRPLPRLGGQLSTSSQRVNCPNWFTQFLALLKDKTSDRLQIKLLPPEKPPGLIGPFQSGYWHGGQRSLPQSLLPWLLPQKGQPTLSASPVMSDVPAVTKVAAGGASAQPSPQAINPAEVMTTPITLHHEATSSAVSASEQKQPKVAFADFDAEGWAEDWINVEVLATEYLDRPLTQLLRGLDQLLTWLEEGCQGLWQYWLVPLLVWIRQELLVWVRLECLGLWQWLRSLRLNKSS